MDFRYTGLYNFTACAVKPRFTVVSPPRLSLPHVLQIRSKIMSGIELLLAGIAIGQWITLASIIWIISRKNTATTGKTTQVTRFG
jgi:hypothetical protein